jgi:acyl carrier protein
MAVDIEQLIKGIAEALEVDPSTINPDSRSSEIEEWDSLGHISVMSYLDKTYNEITERVPDFASATSVQDILDLLNQNT